MAAETDSTTTAEPIKKRVQLEHALFGIDFLHKPKIRALRRRFLSDGVLAYQEIIFSLSGATNAEISADAALCIAEEFDIEDADSFLKYLLSENLVQQTESGRITQDRVINDQESLAKKRERWRKSKGEPSAQLPRGMGAEEVPEPVVEEARFREDLNTEDLKKEEKETVKQLSTITPEAFNAVKRWAAHRKKLCLAFDSMAAEALQLQYAGRSEALIRDINASITANSRNIFQAALPEAERIKIAATAKAEVLKPVEPQRPKPKPFVPLSEPIEPVKAETMAECRRKIQEITRLATPKVSI